MDGKICQDIKTPTPTHIPSSVRLSTWRRLEHQATNSFYTFCYMLIVLKRFLWVKQNLTVLKNAHFFIITASKNIKTQKIKFEIGFSYKDYITSFYFLRITDYGIKSGVTPMIYYDFFPLIWSPLYLISPQSHKFPNGAESIGIV